MKTGAVAIATFALIAGTAFAHGGGGMGIGGGMGMGGGMGGGMGMPSQGMGHIPSGAPLGQPSTIPQGSPVRSGDTIGGTVSTSAKSGEDAQADTDADTGMSESHLGTNAQLQAAADLGKLNAYHASATAYEHASSKSAVGAIATYQKQMKAALSLSDSTAQNAAITAARQQLASSTKVTLTSATASKLDADLGINGASPDLGTNQ